MPRDLIVCRPFFTETGGTIREAIITPYPYIGGVIAVVEEHRKKRIGVRPLSLCTLAVFPRYAPICEILSFSITHGLSQSSIEFSYYPPTLT